MDIGYSSLKVAAGEYGKECQTYSLPAGASPLSLMSNSTVGGDADAIRILIDNDPWVAGVEPVMLQGWTRQLRDEYPKSKQYKALFYAALAKSERETVDVLVTGLPVKQYKDVAFREELKKRLTGTHDISPKRSVTVTDVVVLPQPAGAYMDMVDLSDDNEDLHDMLSEGLSVVLDPGYFSVDWVAFVNGNLMHDYSGTSLEAMSKVIEETNALINTDYAVNVNLDRLEMNIRKGKFRMPIGGAVRDFKAYYDKARETVSQKAITHMINENRSTGVNNEANLVILAGGGGDAFKEVAEAEFKKSQAQVLVSENSALANARGFWKFGVNVIGSQD